MRNDKTVHRAAWVICAAGVLGGGWLLLEYGLPLVAPFLLAWGVAMAVTPLAEKMSAHSRIPRRLCAALILTLALLLLALLLTLAVNRLIFELQRLVGWLGSEGGARIAALFGRVTDWVWSLGESLPFLDFLWSSEELAGVWGSIDEIAAGMIAEAVSGLSGMIPSWIAAVLRALPGIALFLAAWIIASYYFCLDLRAIHAALSVLIPASWREKLPTLRRRAAGTALRWLRAYMLLLALTFGELLIGFSILGLDYAFLLALGIAIVDLLPVFGVGTVLIPWAVVLFIGGNYSLGLGILIIYGVVAVVRQVAEPRIVGGSIGLHPLLTLAAMYVGFKLFGIAGMLLSPAAALALGLFVGGEEKL
ncbi:MAG: sporulation integral membrane protein YtvI [Clostridia bacterium]|nr:sporulation integral membrane protein YtvI [Clostridia bacterium]